MTHPTDTHGRPWAKLSDLNPGDKIELDAGFTCAAPGSVHEVVQEDGELSFCCDAGFHDLSGQLDDDPDILVGIYPHNDGSKAAPASAAPAEAASATARPQGPRALASEQPRRA